MTTQEMTIKEVRPMPNDEFIQCDDCGQGFLSGSVPDDRLQYDEFLCRDDLE